MQADVRDLPILLIIPTTTYNTGDFMAAASRLGVDVIVASDKQQVLEKLAPGKTLTLPFNDVDGAVETIVRFCEPQPVGAIVGVDDHSVILAAFASKALGIGHNDPEAVQAAGNKLLLRRRLAAAGLPTPAVSVFDTALDAGVAAAGVTYPCVLKPTFLAASRGVIRADNEAQFIAAFERIQQLLADPALSRRGGDAARQILVEEYIPGDEVAVEGLLRSGELSVLALFDKPDPLEGPFFAETMYVTPSRLDGDRQAEVERMVALGAAALGLREGPVHAELRLAANGMYPLEIAARSIGGLCSRILRFGAGLSLEELVLSHAIGSSPEHVERQGAAAGVMMLPVPSAGVLRRVEGVEAARLTPGIEDVVMTIPRGEVVVPLPEGDRYLGFMFAAGQTPIEVEMALRRAYRQLDIVIDSEEP